MLHHRVQNSDTNIYNTHTKGGKMETLCGLSDCMSERQGRGGLWTDDQGQGARGYLSKPPKDNTEAIVG